MRRKPSRVERVLQVFLDAPDAQHYGLDIAKKARFRWSTPYPELARLETSGRISSGWEYPPPADRRRRRVYWLTRS